MRKEKIIKNGWAGEIKEVTENGKVYIYKSYGDGNNDKITLEKDGLRILKQNNINVPDVKLTISGEDENYIIMSKIIGKSLWDLINEQKNDDLMRKFVNLFCSIHNINDTKNGTTSSFLVNEIELLESDAAPYRFNNFKKVIKWLKDRSSSIEEYENVFLHRDYHPWNVIVSENELFVFDLQWCYGDYRFDVAWTASLMKRSGYGDFTKEFVKLYENISGKELFNYEYFEVLANVRWLVNILNSLKYENMLNKDRKDEFADFVSGMASRAVSEIKEITGIQIYADLSGESIINKMPGIMLFI